MKQDVNSEPTEANLSRINAAGLINITTENLWRDAYNAMAKSDLVTWNRKLDAIWCVLGGDVERNSEEDKEFLKIDLKLHELGKLNHIKTGFEKMGDDESSTIAKQYLYLRTKSLFLRRLQNTQGKGTAYQSDDDDDMD